MKKGFLVVVVVILVSGLILAGCSSPAPAPSPAPTSAPAPATSTAPSSIAPAAPKPTASASATTAAPAQVIKLKYADQNPGPETGWGSKYAAQPFLDSIEKATNGRVKMEPYYAQTLCKGTDAWEATKNGVTDVAWCFHGYWANMTPLSDVLTLPLLPFLSAEQGSGIFWQLYQKYPTLANQFKDNHVLLGWTTTPYWLFTVKKQVKTMDDLKGLKIRVISGPPVELMKSLGAVPVMIGQPDVYLSLQKGVIDGTANTFEAMWSFRQFEQTKYFNEVPLYASYFTQAINNDVWKGLPADVQKQIESVCGLNGSKAYGKGMFDTSNTQVPDLIKQQGFDMVKYTLTPDELNKWTETAGKPLWSAWVQKMKGAGYPEAQEILNTTLDLIKTYKP